MSKDTVKVRKANARKAIMTELRALKKIEAAIVKAKDTIALNSDAITGDTYNQIAQVFSQLNVAVTVADAAVIDKANKLAQTYVK